MRIGISVVDDIGRGYEVAIQGDQMTSRAHAIEVASIVLNDIFDQVANDSKLPDWWA